MAFELTMELDGGRLEIEAESMNDLEKRMNDLDAKRIEDLIAQARGRERRGGTRAGKAKGKTSTGKRSAKTKTTKGKSKGKTTKGRGARSKKKTAASR